MVADDWGPEVGMERTPPTSMKNFSACLVFGLGMTTAAWAATPVTMTFDLLASDFSDYSSYTENGLTLASTAGGTQRFYASGVIGNTAATIYQYDGDLLQLTANTPLFDLNSVDFTEFATDTTALVTASTGASETVSTIGTVTFGAGFQHASWVRFTFGTSSSADPYYTIDNIKATQVPEPATWGSIAGVALGAWALQRRRNR